MGVRTWTVLAALEPIILSQCLWALGLWFLCALQIAPGPALGWGTPLAVLQQEGQAGSPPEPPLLQPLPWETAWERGMFWKGLGWAGWGAWGSLRSLGSLCLWALENLRHHFGFVHL